MYNSKLRTIKQNLDTYQFNEKIMTQIKNGQISIETFAKVEDKEKEILEKCLKFLKHDRHG